MQAFKYFPDIHKNDFIEQGVIKVGTINHYRRNECNVRRDTDEGVYTFSFTPTDQAIELTSEQVNAITRDYRLKDGIRLRVEVGGGFTSNLSVPNAYVYCASNGYSAGLRGKFGGGCFRIKNTKIFGNLLFKELSKIQEILFWVARPVIYVQTKTIVVTNDNKDKVIPRGKFAAQSATGMCEIQIDDYFTKTTFFKHEDEYRFLFVPKDSPKIEELLIRNRAITEVCAIV